jgi:uncharacterized protein (TIGR02996 family)
MSDEAALLAAIRDDPEDDTPRLVYADWLDDQGGESNADRAEYIRLEIDLARAGVRRAAPPEWKEKQARSRSLFSKHYREWFPELFGRKNILRGVRGSPGMARGFPYKLQGRFDKLLSIGQRLMQLAPFTELHPGDLTSWGLQQFAGASWTGGLRKLGLSGGYGSSQPNWAALAEGKHFEELRETYIIFGWLDRAGAARLASANPFPKLERFSFGSYSSDDAPAALFSGATFTGLRSLALSGGGSRLSSNPMPGLKEICESAALCSLKVLDLRWRPTPGLTSMLTSATFWPGLEELDLLRNNLGDDDLAAMLNTPSKLRRLELNDNKITEKGAELLATHPALENITTLALSGNAIRDQGVTALVNSPRAANLQKLEISGCEFGRAGITAIAESPHLENLRELRMHSNGLDLVGARLLAASPHLANLDWLYIGGGLTATARKALKERFGDRVSL